MRNLNTPRLTSLALLLVLGFLPQTKCWSQKSGVNDASSKTVDQKKQPQEVILTVDAATLQKNFEVEVLKKNQVVRLVPHHAKGWRKAKSVKEKAKFNLAGMNDKGIVFTGIQSSFNFPDGANVLAGLAQYNRQRLDSIYKQFKMKRNSFQLPVSISLRLKFISVNDGVIRFSSRVSISCGSGGYACGLPEIWEYKSGKFHLIRPVSGWGAFG